jgi:CBS domain-containing protein
MPKLNFRDRFRRLKSPKLYSLDRLQAFLVLLLAYLVVFAILWGAKEADMLGVIPSIKGVQDIFFSMPFIALYIVILIGFTAGYAQSAFAAKSLGLIPAVKQKLRARSMESLNIKRNIHADPLVTMDTSLLSALEKVTKSRLPILAIIENDRIEKVITMHDIMQKLTDEISDFEKSLHKPDDKDLFTTLYEIKVENLKPKTLVSVKEDDNLDSALDKMMQHQISKLVVVDKAGKTCVGTINLFDIMSELLSEPVENT